MRDPHIQQISLVNDILHSFCKRDRRATKIASACSDYLLENNGENLAFLFDGYDEYPEVLQKDSLIADILNRKELPCCSFVVSSHPHASVKLREQATVKVDILGFTETERYNDAIWFRMLQRLQITSGFDSGVVHKAYHSQRNFKKLYCS